MQSISQSELLGYCSECHLPVYKDTMGRVRWDRGHEECEGAYVLPEEDADDDRA